MYEYIAISGWRVVITWMCSRDKRGRCTAENEAIVGMRMCKFSLCERRPSMMINKMYLIVTIAAISLPEGIIQYCFIYV